MRIESCPRCPKKGREETLRKARSKLFQPQRGPGSKPAILISDPIPRGEPGILISAPISPYLCEAAILISPELGALVTRFAAPGRPSRAVWWHRVGRARPHIEIITGSHTELPANGLRGVAYRSINLVDAPMYRVMHL